MIYIQFASPNIPVLHPIIWFCPDIHILLWLVSLQYPMQKGMFICRKDLCYLLSEVEYVLFYYENGHQSTNWPKWLDKLLFSIQRNSYLGF